MNVVIGKLKALLADVFDSMMEFCHNSLSILALNALVLGGSAGVYAIMVSRGLQTEANLQLAVAISTILTQIVIHERNDNEQH